MVGVSCPQKDDILRLRRWLVKYKYCMKNLFIFLFLLCLFLLGCASFDPISPLIQIGVYWMEGEAHKYYHTEQSVLLPALRATLIELDLSIFKEEQKGDTTYIKAGDDDRFKIKVHAVRAETTKVSIRVNTFGDKPYTEMIYRHLDAQPGVEQFVSIEELQAAMRDDSRSKRRLSR